MRYLIRKLKKLSTQPLIKAGVTYVTVLNNGLKTLKKDIPVELAEFYNEINGCILFKDEEYEQWGMKIYAYDNLKEQNEYIRTWKENLIKTDLVIAEFLGDLDLLIMSQEEKNYGKIIVATPLYERKDWFFLKCNFNEFLDTYIKHEGGKFWE